MREGRMKVVRRSCARQPNRQRLRPSATALRQSLSNSSSLGAQLSRSLSKRSRPTNRKRPAPFCTPHLSGTTMRPTGALAEVARPPRVPLPDGGDEKKCRDCRMTLSALTKMAASARSVLCTTSSIVPVTTAQRHLWSTKAATGPGMSDFQI